MREVACGVFEVVFREMRRKKVPFEVLVTGTSCTVAELQDKHGRVDWNDYVAAMANVSKVFTSEELVSMGGHYFRSPILRPIAIASRLLFTALDLYRWNTGSEGSRRLFSCIHPAGYKEKEGNQIELDLVMDDGYEPCKEFFLISKGALIEMPRLVGLGSATVEVSEIARGAHYRITYPEGGGALAGLRKAVTWPFTARAAARELRQAHASLLDRYQELDAAQAQLARQKTQLETAHTISDAMRQSLGLDTTLQAVVNALVTVGKFEAARVVLATDAEGESILRSERYGEEPVGIEPIRVQLEIRGRELGTMSVWPTPDADRTERQQLLDYVVPTTAMALDDALTFTSVVDYRNNLERKVEARTTELKQALSVRERIFANINHELRTPLALIRLAARDLQRHYGTHLDDRGQRRLNNIDYSVRHLLDLVDGLLLLAAAQEDKLRLRPTSLDLAANLRQLVSAWCPTAEEEGLHLFYEGLERSLVRLDEAATERIVTNLVSNAIKFTPSGGTVVVSLHEAGDHVEINVRDTGVGVPEEMRERIFERFEQGIPAVRAATHGSGIGLSIVRELAEAHGGNVRLEAGRSSGSAFTVTLPREYVGQVADPNAGSRVATPSPPPKVRAAVSKPPEELRPVRQTAEATILVAEDDPELLATLGELLGEEYRVMLAPDGLTALQLAREHHPDLLVSDVGMPGMDGFELTRCFQELPGNRLAPVLLLSAYSQVRDRLSGLAAGAVDYILKPFEPDELMARVRSQLQLRRLALNLHESEKLASLGVLSAGLAHEIRNPANAVVNAIEPLRMQLPDPLLQEGTPTAALIDAIETYAQQIAELARELLGLARPGELERREENLSALVQRAIELADDASYQVEVAIDEEISLWCSGPLIGQIITALINNAVQAGGPNGLVTVKAHVSEDSVVIDVGDSGPGVAMELREKIFDPFFTTKPPGVGTGLGLTVARMIASRHGGSLRVTDGPEGSVFRLELPLRPSQVGDDDEPQRVRYA